MKREFAALVLAAALLAGCREAERPDSDVNYISGNYLSHANTKKIVVSLMKAGFTDRAQIANMVCLANGESNMGDLNFNGSCCFGLFQIHSVHKGTSLCPEWKSEAGTSTYSEIIRKWGGISTGNIAFFDTNAKCARRILAEQGYGAWESWGVHCGRGSLVRAIPDSIYAEAQAEVSGRRPAPQATASPAPSQPVSPPQQAENEYAGTFVRDEAPPVQSRFRVRLRRDAHAFPILVVRDVNRACIIRAGTTFTAISAWRSDGFMRVTTGVLLPGTPTEGHRAALLAAGKPAEACPLVGGWVAEADIEVTPIR